MILIALGIALVGINAIPPAYIHKIQNRSDFDGLARTTDFPYPLSHVFFLIDRRHENAMYYINSNRFESHRSFANATYLSLEKGQRFFQNNYLRPDRRFFMGTLAYQDPVHKWTYEFWEGDLIDQAGLQTVDKAIKSSFFAPVLFKPNSLHQEEISESTPRIPRILPSEIQKPSFYSPISLGRAVGRIHILADFTPETVVRPDEILVLSEAPVDLPPIAGIVTTQPASPLSHISLRSKSLGIPDAYLENADKLFARFNGQVVQLVTKPDQYLIGKPTPLELNSYLAQKRKVTALLTPSADLTVTRIAQLSEQRKTMVTSYGAKSANLGETMGAHIAETEIPDGFTLPSMPVLWPELTMKKCTWQS